MTVQCWLTYDTILYIQHLIHHRRVTPILPATCVVTLRPIIPCPHRIDHLPKRLLTHAQPLARGLGPLRRRVPHAFVVVALLAAQVDARVVVEDAAAATAARGAERAGEAGVDAAGVGAVAVEGAEVGVVGGGEGGGCRLGVGEFAVGKGGGVLGVAWGVGEVDRVAVALGAGSRYR